MKSLPARPSLASLQKQAKKLAHDTAAGDAGAIARARAHLPHADLPLTQRNAQFVIAREYGFAGWQDLSAEVSKRLGNGLEWAVAQARRVIHNNDVERLRQLLVEYPALLSWRGNDSDAGLLGIATDSYGDSFEPDRERNFTRAACAEALIDAGAVVMPAVCERILASRARGLLQLFHRKGLLPPTLEYFAALGDLAAVRTALDGDGNDLAEVNEAFMCACSLHHETVASVLLDRAIALDPELGKRVDEGVGRSGFIKYFIDERNLAFSHAAPNGPWQSFLMDHVMRTVQEGDVPAFVNALKREQWILGDACVDFQKGLIERATMRDRPDIIIALLDLGPALVRHKPTPPSQALEFALTYARTRLIPLLARIWPLPDDLPHAAGVGDLARVKQWFDETGAPALGDLGNHFPYSAHTGMDYQWSASRLQVILDTALAWSVVNRHFDVADFLLEHGADVNTRWGSHEPASILHELVAQVGSGEQREDRFESMQFLVDRGIDMTIEDYRWNATPLGWAIHAAKDEKMAQWLKDAERQREQRP